MACPQNQLQEKKNIACGRIPMDAFSRFRPGWAEK
jgi:hypothetical protein